MAVFTLRKAARQGKKDGRNWEWQFWPFLKREKPRLPREGQTETAAFEKAVLNGGEVDIAKIAEEWEQLDEILKRDYCVQLTQYNAAKNRLTKEKAEAKSALRDFERVKKQYDDYDHPPLSPRAMKILLILVAIAEFPFNSIVFNLLGASRLETFIMSAGICFAIPFVGHHFGQTLRLERKNTVDKLFLYVDPIFIIFVICGISYLRWQYVSATEVVDLIGIKLSPFMLIILFISMNLAMFLLAMIIAYEGTHPRHKEYKNLLRRFREAKKRLERETRDVEVALRNFEVAEEKLNDIRNERKKKFSLFQQQAQTIQQRAELLISVYRTENLRQRNDTPECFRKEIPIISFPPALQQLDWECEERS